MPSNAQSKLIRSLHRKKARREQGLFLVEGEKVVAELLASEWQVHSLYASLEFLQNNQNLVQQSGVVVIECDADKLSTVGTLQSNKAALAIVHCPEYAKLPCLDKNAWALALDSINDPGNLGSILRIADWYGINQVVCSPCTVELFNPKVIAASKGAFLQGESVHQIQPTIAKQRCFSS